MALFRYKDSKTQALADHLNETAQRQFTQEELFQFAPYDPDAGERGGYSGYSYWRSTLRAFRKDRTAMFFLCVIALTLLFTFSGAPDPLRPAAQHHLLHRAGRDQPLHPPAGTG